MFYIIFNYLCILDEDSNSKLKLTIKKTTKLQYRVCTTSDSKVYYQTDMKFKIKNNQIVCEKNKDTIPMLEGRFVEFRNKGIDVEYPIYSPHIILGTNKSILNEIKK